MVQPTPHVTVGFLILCVHFWEVRLYYETPESFVVYGFVLFTKWLSLITSGPSWKLKSLYFFDLHLSEKYRKSSLREFSDYNQWSNVSINPIISNDRLKISAHSQHYLRPLLLVHPRLGPATSRSANQRFFIWGNRVLPWARWTTSVSFKSSSYHEY